MTAPTEEASSTGGDPIVGRVVAGNFRIERLIGSGAMGNVYKAEQLSLGKEVAVKVLHPHLMSDDKLVLRFQREAKSASRLNHVNSIQIIDSGRDASGYLYIAMELLTGRDLAQVIRDEFPLPLPRVVRIMTQVLSALDEAHAEGVIHRDLKPSNIMLIERRGEPDFVKVCDYGIAKAQLEEGQGDGQMLTIQGLVCGTPEYMSPEQARGEVLDGRSDLYSAAVILYHMVTGDIPFRAATPIGIVSRHLSEAPVVPSARCSDPSIPADLDDLILRGLAKSRELRPESAAVFREELESVGAGRVGRRARGSQETVRATEAISPADGQTISMAATAGERRVGGQGRSMVAGFILLAGVAIGATALFRQVKSPDVGGTSLTVSVPVKAAAKSETPAAAEVPTLTPDEVQARGVAPTPPSEGPAAAEPMAEPSVSPPMRDSKVPAVPAGATARSHRGLSGASLGGDRAAARKHPGARGGLPTAAPPPGPVGVAPPSPARAAVAIAPPTGGAAADEKLQDKLDPATAGPAAGHTPRELIAQGEKLLAHGEVTEACRRGEEAKQAGAKLPATYKFLGKCYMRAGDPARAKDNYRRYLELAPDASDAMFIESIVK